MRLAQNEVVGRRLVGKMGKAGVWLVSGIGGINVIADDAGKILGAGVVPGVARHVARTAHPGIVFDALDKSEAVDPAIIARHLPAAIELTARMVAAQAAAA